jgi:hypothetical protein
MDQTSIVLDLRMKEMALDAIHDDLVCTLGKDAVAYSTVTKYARSTQFSGRKEATDRRANDLYSGKRQSESHLGDVQSN